jgi:hypothetical protein
VTETASVPAAHDGRNDFDFLHGHWHVANRKLRDPFDSASDWLEFPARVETRPILNGLGNLDTYLAPDFPGRPHFEALALRLFDIDNRLWRIWWASTTGGGRLDTPLVGGFQDSVGVFECDDTLAGRKLKVRFEWTNITSASARWQQSFSFDGGQTWQPNWIMDWKRRPNPE